MSKYKDKAYRQQVRDWMRAQRSADKGDAVNDMLRDRLRGSLATGGAAGFAPPTPKALQNAAVPAS